MKEVMLQSILSDLKGNSADIEATAVISIDGLVIASALPKELDEDRVGAMSAAMLSLGDRTAAELSRGSLEQVMIKGEHGYVLLIHAGEEAVLTIVANQKAKLGMVFLDANRAAKSIAELI